MIVGYAFGFIFCLGTFYLGRIMRVRHADAARFFFLAPVLAAKYFRVVGSFLMVMSAAGMLLYAILTLVYFI